ncbi:lactate 2-monooxygenase [Sphingomonas laterariae]|uniref:Lactate 2-monooxygenase n=1 Tax=Edaphosphingomonas laterariae TaxID=861865 RepID=A0A239GZC6_9SPHN|nr:alpha-hydroxy-acid oxidizing protein [Sphingomonas laterariae]SNS74138.1 lactate 2-monooxygenase [Sphingomonas laterariae]
MTASDAAATAPDAAIGPVRQSEIYLAGRLPEPPVDPDALRAAAEAALPEAAFAYIDGGAGTGSTMAENRHALDRWRIVPRMLASAEQRHSGVDLFGRALRSPLLLAPIGVQELAHADGDLATARAAATEQVPMIFSNQASVPMEETAEAMGDAPRWFQLYWSRSDDLIASLIARAEDAGCDAIVVTLDTPLLGWRNRDLDLASLPFLHAKGIAQYLSDPVFRAMLSDPPEDDPMAAIARFLAIYTNPAIGWADLPALCARCRLPVLVKGILDPADAERAIDAGVDGIIVSNHGGRQVDGAVGAADALERIVAAVGTNVPILFDSGIRSGADMFRALALGARAVLIGRPYIYGLAVAGEAGVRAVIRNLLAEFDLTMALAGCRTIAEIDRSRIIRRE